MGHENTTMRRIDYIKSETYLCMHGQTDTHTDTNVSRACDAHPVFICPDTGFSISMTFPLIMYRKSD